MMADHILAMILDMLAGGLTFFFVFNRFILRMTQGPLKTMTTYVTLVLLTVGPGVVGWWHGLSRHLILSLGLLLIVFIGEFRRRSWQRNHRVHPEAEWDAISNADGFRFITTDHLKIRNYRIPLPDWPRERTRIVHISDLHIDHALPLSYYEKAFEAVNRLHPDLLFLTGDFVDRADRLMDALHLFRELKPAIGCYAVLGNHDYWAGETQIRQLLQQAGITVISGESRMVGIAEDISIPICGTEFPWGPMFPADAVPVDDCPIQIVLTHTPDNFFQFVDGAGYKSVEHRHWTSLSEYLSGSGKKNRTNSSAGFREFSSRSCTATENPSAGGRFESRSYSIAANDGLGDMIPRSCSTACLDHRSGRVSSLAVETTRTCLVFAGHLHGGQWRLPIVGSLVSPSNYGRLLDHGHFKVGDSHLFVTSGLGTIWMPVRILCEPEILVVDIVPSE